MMYIIYIAHNVSVCYCLANKASIFVVENTRAKPLCLCSTIFLSVVTLRQPLENKNIHVLRT